MVGKFMQKGVFTWVLTVLIRQAHIKEDKSLLLLKPPLLPYRTCEEEQVQSSWSWIDKQVVKGWTVCLSFVKISSIRRVWSEYELGTNDNLGW